jgi:hypothetical protein
MKKLLLLLSVLLLVISLFIINSCHKPKPFLPSITTDIIIQNSSAKDSIQVFVTLQSGESVIGLFGMDSSNINPNPKLWCENIVGTDTTMIPCKGSFWAKKGIEYYLGRNTEVAGAVISFGADNYGCEAAIFYGWQSGINIFEFTINTPSTGNESTDLSCLDGLNSYLKMTVSDSINWIAGGNIFKNPAENKWPLNNNCGIIGVYPYHCDVCCDTLTPPRPACFPFNGCSKTNGINNCQLDRATVRGGYIKCEFLGFTPVILN